MKKAFAKEDSRLMLLCVCLPPVGYALAWRRGWISARTAGVAVVLNLVATAGSLLAGYSHSANAILALQAMWGLLMVIAICGQYTARRGAAITARLLLALLIGELAFVDTPSVGWDCLLHCGAIDWHTLGGERLVLFSGAPLVVFLVSLYGLFALAVWLNARNALE